MSLIQSVFFDDTNVDWLATSPTIIPRMTQLIPKKKILASQRPGTKVDSPKNSSLYPCCNQTACPNTQAINDNIPSYPDLRKTESGR